MILAPYLFAPAGGGSGFVGSLDAYSSDAFFVGGDKRMLSSWTGPLRRMRRADAAEVDTVYRSDDDPTEDSAALLSWAGSLAVVCIRVYDQTGQGNHFEPSGAGHEPKVADGGALIDGGGLYSDGVDDDMQCVNAAPSGVTAWSIFRDADIRSYGSAQFLYELGIGSTDADSCQEWPGWNNSGAGGDVHVYMNHGAGYSSYTDKGWTNTGAAGLGTSAAGAFGMVLRKALGVSGTGSNFMQRFNAVEGSMGAYENYGTDVGGGQGGASGSEFSQAKWVFMRRNGDGATPLACTLFRWALFKADKRTSAQAMTRAVERACWGIRDSSIALSSGRSLATKTGSPGHCIARGAKALPSTSAGYFELYFPGATFTFAGVTKNGGDFANFLGNDIKGYGYYANNGKVYNNFAGTSVGTDYGDSWGSGATIGVAFKNGSLWFAKNGVWQGGGDPAAGTGAAFTGISSFVFPAASLQAVSPTDSVVLRCKLAEFAHDPPAGFPAWEDAQ